MWRIGLVVKNLGLGLHEGCRKAADLRADIVQLHMKHEEIDLVNATAVERAEEATRIGNLGLGISAICAVPEGDQFKTPEASRDTMKRWTSSVSWI